MDFLLLRFIGYICSAHKTSCAYAYDPDDAGEESPDPVPQTAEDEPNNANSISTTQNFFPIFSRKPLIYFKANPPKFSSHEVKDPPKKKSKSKAKKVQTKTETTSKTLNYFWGTAAANNIPDPP